MSHRSRPPAAGSSKFDPICEKRAVHVWSLDLSSWSDDHRHVLSAEERRRANRYRFEPDQRRYLRCRSALREILGSYLRIPPTEVQFDYGSQGKPELASHSPDSLHFNLTHSGELALIALSSLAPVGIDLERVRPLNDLDSVAKVVLGESDWQAFMRTSHAARTNMFYAIWTRKEAVVKALGLGLQAPIQSLQVPADPSISQFSVGLTNWSAGATACQVWDLSVAANYRASLAMVHDSSEKIDIRQFVYDGHIAGLRP